MITRGSAAGASAGANSFRTTGFQANGISTANNDYFQVTLSASTGYTLSVTGIVAQFAGTASFYATPGVADQWAYSLDGSSFTLIGSSNVSTSLNRAWDFSGVTALQGVDATNTVTLRYYASGRTSTGGWGFNNTSGYGLNIGGSVDAAATTATVHTAAATETNTTSMRLGGNVTSDGGASVTNRGVVYKTTAGVTIADNKTAIGSGTGSFTQTISSLSVNTRYYFRAYAQNSVGTALGNESNTWTLANTPSAPTVNNATASSLDVTINENGNPSSTEFAIRRTSDNQYLQSDGTWGASADWATKTTWGTKTATGLAPSTTYYFEVKARNGVNVETAFGATGNDTTLSSGCSTEWHALYDRGNPLATYFLGDSLTGKYEFALGRDTTGWTVEYGLGTSQDGSSWTWRNADWSRMDGANRVWISKTNEHVFSSTGTWYYAGRFDDTGGCIYYADEDWESTSGGSLFATNFFTVNPINSPTSPDATRNNGDPVTMIDLSWSKNAQSHNVMIVRKLTAQSWTEPTQGTAYSVSNSIGAGVVVYKGSGTSTTDSGLTGDVGYDYKFYSINNDYYSTGVTASASTLAAEPGAAPTLQAFTSVTETSMTINWTGVSTQVLVVVRASSDLNANPVDASTYTANATYGSGTALGSGYVVYKGSGTSVNLTGLNAGTEYYVRVYNFNGGAGAENYRTASFASGSATTCPQPPASIWASATNMTDFTASWSSASGATNYLLDVSTNAQFVGQDVTDTEDFETGLPTSYTSTTNYSLATGQWSGQANGVIRGTAGKVSGFYSLQLRSQTGAMVVTPTLSNGVKDVSFYASASTGAGGFQINISTNDGATFSAAPGSPFSVGTSITNISIAISNPAVNKIQIYRTAVTIYIDDFSWTSYGGGDAFVPGYEARPVSGTSASVTGLTALVTYYFRVVAQGEYCDSGFSPTGSVTTVLVAPDVAVLGTNLALIANGDTSPTFAKGTDFGSVGVNVSNVVRTYTITNAGNSSLSLNNVVTQGTHVADFIVVSQPAASVPAGGTTTFQVRFDPNAAGTRTAKLVFTNSVAAKSPYTFDVQGVGVLAGAYVSPASITVTTMVGTALGSASFGVTNVGRGRLDYAITTNVSWLSVSPVSAQLAETAGQQETISFNVAGLSAGTNSGTITVDGGATASNTVNVNVTLVVTNIPNPSAGSATGDGSELVRLAWTKHASFDVMIVYDTSAISTEPTQGTSYSVGNSIGTGKVIYKGNGAALEHVIPPGGAAFYKFYSVNNNHYSLGVTDDVSLPAYLAGAILEQGGYTNGVNLAGLNGGQGWSSAWATSNAGTWMIQTNYADSGNDIPMMPTMSNYPNTVANRMKVDGLANNDQAFAYRSVSRRTNGQLYVSALLAFKNFGSDNNRFVGISLLDSGSEKAFVGRAGGNNVLAIDATGSAKTESGYALNGTESGAGGSTGNVYLIVAKYDFAANKVYAKAFYRTDVVGEGEPAWAITNTPSSSIAGIDGVRIGGGGYSGSNIGAIWFDEVHVATNWNQIVPSSGTPGIGVGPSAINVSIMRGATPSAQSLAVTNIGLGVLNYDITTNASWISVTPTSSSLGAGVGQSHSVSLAVSDFAVGIYTGGLIITSGAASNSPQHVLVTVTVTNIPPVLSPTVNADGNEMVRLGWVPPSGVPTLILHGNAAIGTDPTQGTAYSVDDTIGGATVIYIGGGSALEHIVPPGSTNYYAAYSISGDYYSTRTNMGSVVMGVYRANEIVDQVAYTNGGALTSPAGNGGWGWTSSWTAAEQTWVVLSNNHAEISFPQQPAYPTNAANIIKLVNPGDSVTGRVHRYFAPISTGTVYIAGFVAYQYEGPSKFAGLSFMSGNAETGFVGKISDASYYHTLGIDTFGGGRIFSSYDLRGLDNSTNNTYLVIGKYDLDAMKIYGLAYYRGVSVPDMEPAEWSVTATVSAVSAIDGVRMQGGADTGSIGNVYFDEIRVARTWGDLVNKNPPVVLTRPITNIQPTTAVGGGDVISTGGMTVTNRGVVWTTNGTPTIADSRTSDGTGLGIYGSTMTGLIPGETYYVRAFAQNPVGIGYGAVSNFTAACFTTIVTNLYVNPTNTTDFTLHWSPLDGATEYGVDVSVSPTFGGAANYGVEPFGRTIIGGGTVSSYLTRDWTNAYGVVWTAEKARTDQTIDGDALTLQNANGAYLVSQSITGGVSELRVTHQRAFGSGEAHTFDIFVNGTKVATNITYGSAIQTAVVQNLNFPGSFTIMITNSGSERLSIDNVTWTNSGSSYVSGYEDRPVAGTSVAVTGLESAVTYYFRVRAETPHCVSDSSATGSVMTRDGVAPDLFNFNVDGRTNTDAEVSAGFAVTGMVSDVGAGVSNGPATPYFFIRNSVGVTIASNTFSTAPANGTTAPSALAGTFGPVPQANVVLGIYTATVSAVDLTGNAVTSNFVFTVIDDDVEPPALTTIHAPVTNGGALRAMQISIGSTNLTGSGGSNNWVYGATDGQLVSVSAGNPLRFWLGARDDSGINRGTTNPATNMNFTLDGIVISNVANFDATLSSTFAQTTNARATNVWTWIAPFSNAEITQMMTNTVDGLGSNRISVAMSDADADRIADALGITNQQYGFLVVTDDDVTVPVANNMTINGIGMGGAENEIFVETMGTAGSNGDSIATHESNNRFANVSFTMSGTGDMRTTSDSSPSDYPSASGSFNAMLNAASEYFQIAGIDSSGQAGMKLYYGIRKNSTAESGSTMALEGSTNGTTWVSLGAVSLPTGAGTAVWHYRTNSVPDSLAGTNLYIRFTSSSTVEFRIDDVRLTSSASDLVLTDGDIAWGGYTITSMVHDVHSGLAVSNAFAPHFITLNPVGQQVVADNFATPFPNAGATTSMPATVLAPAAASTNYVVLGTYTTLVYVTDADDDRGDMDRLGSTNLLVFPVIDDDTNAPIASAFFLTGSTTNFDLGDSSVAITGLLSDASGVLYDGSTHFVLLDNVGAIVQSNILYAGSGNAATGLIYSGTLNCGQDYTVRVFAVDSDRDRASDQLSITQAVLVIRTTGVGGPADYPIASNLLVNGSVASPSVQLLDSTIATGGWSVAFNLSHPVGVFTNAASPSFRVTNEVGEVIAEMPWTNTVHVGDTYYFTNNNLPAASYSFIQTGLHYVVWSASNQGSCVAMIIDRGAIEGGTNVFAVIDDDDVPPVASGFAVVGGGATIDVDQAFSGFSVTGLLQDVDSGIGFTSQPPHLLFYDITGALLASNTLTGGAEGDGKATAVAVSSWISGLSLACGNSYTVRVVSADADNDRANDGASAEEDVLIITTSGSDGEAPTAKDLMLNGTAASVVTLTDSMIATGGWRVALAFEHTSGNILTNGPGAPSFSVLNSGGTSVFGATPIQWSNIVKSGATYFATNSPMAAADTNLVTTGLFSIVWSAQSEGLCFGSTNGSVLINPGTNRFLVIDDDSEPPNVFGVNVGGGTGNNNGCGGDNACPDPTRTNLIAGDIAIFALNTKTFGIGPNMTNNDSFGFVALVDIPPGTEIKFTDNGWSSSKNAFRANEGFLTWRATNCVGAGTVVRWVATNNPTVNIGSIVATNGSFAPNIQGEQLLAFQGPTNNPNFIYAINDRLTGLWDADAFDSHSSALPPGLADGYTAVAVNEFDNVIINTNVLSISGGREMVLYYLGDRENWIGQDDPAYDLASHDFIFPDLCSAGGVITDQDLFLGGWSITGLVQDVGSGLLVSNAAGVRYMVINTNAGVVVSNYFATTFASGSKTLNSVSNAIPGGDYYTIQLGVHTARIFAADADADRPFDSAERMTNVPFTVIDDDYDIPQIGYFFINGKTEITNAAELFSVVISGQVRDVTSGIAFTSAPPQYAVLDSIGNTVASGGFASAPSVEGAGVNWTSIWTAPMNLAGIADCGVYTVRVTVADADNDRVADRMQTNLSFVISVATGSGEEPVASNLLVNAVAAQYATLTDGDLAAGGWSLAMTLHHPLGVTLDSPNEPSFIFSDPGDNPLIADVWTNISDEGSNVYVTNAGLPSIAYANVNTGFFSVVWSARGLGACFGEVFDSPFFTDGTNLIFVVDDDTVGPTAASNFVSTAVNWTNNPVITYTWDTSTVHDASGVAHFRLITNNLAPTSMLDGIQVGLTNSVTITNTTEGAITNWLFAIDADNDRANDGAMGAATSTVVYLDFTAPNKVSNFSAAPGSVDDTSEMDLNWTPLADGGNAALSPWNTYRVYYTESGSDPTTNDAFFDLALYPDLATNVTSTLTLQGLTMGSEYRVAMTGLDRAGNEGPLSDVQIVTLSQIIITQAFANANSDPELFWFGNPSAYYDVIYVDSTSYTAALDAEWKLAKTVQGTTFVDEGGYDEGTDHMRVPVIELPDRWIRFYRVASVNAWIPTALRQGGATEQIVSALKTTLTNGYNFIGLTMMPFTNRLASFLGTNRLPAAAAMHDSTAIYTYDPSFSGDANSNAWWLGSDGEWKYELGGVADDQALPVPLSGFGVVIPASAVEATNFVIVGRVPWQGMGSYTFETGRYHVVALNLPRPTRMVETGLKDYLTRHNSNYLLADEMRVMRAGAGPLDTPKARIFVDTNGVYRSIPSKAVMDNYVVEVDESIIVFARRLATPTLWSMPLPYPAPHLHITNRLDAAPIVVAQAPISVTETSAVLRGLVTPNGLTTSAHIDYGLTTNYGSSVAATNLPGTNVAYQLLGSISGLSQGSLYYFRVWASNSAGISRFGTSSFSTLGYCTNTVPAAPDASATDGTSLNFVSVTWNNVANEAGYEVWRNTVDNSGTSTWLADRNADVTSYDDTSAVPGQEYYYWIRAFNCAGNSGYGDSDDGYRKLAIVSGLSASFNTFTNRVEVQWSNSTGETGYGVYRYTSDNSGSAAYIGSVAADVLVYTDTTAAVDTMYYYWVRATNSTSSSRSDFQAGGVTGRASSISLPTLTSLVVSNITTTTAYLGATITSDGGASAGGGTVWGTALNPTGNVGYGATGVGAFSAMRSSMPAGTLIYFRAWATNAIGIAYSTNGSFWTRPLAPTVYSDTKAKRGTYTFQASWAPVAGATNYLIDVSQDYAFGSYISGYQRAGVGSVTSVIVNTGQAGTTNYWRIAAQNSGGTSVYSTIATNYTLAQPPAVQSYGIFFTNITPTSVQVVWTNGDSSARLVVMREGAAVDGLPENATAYSVGMSGPSNTVFGLGAAIGSSYAVATNNAPSGVSSLTVTGLTANTVYFVRIFEYNYANPSAASVNHRHYLTNSAALNPNGVMTLP